MVSALKGPFRSIPRRSTGSRSSGKVKSEEPSFTTCVKESVKLQKSKKNFRQKNEMYKGDPRSLLYFACFLYNVYNICGTITGQLIKEDR